MPRVWGGSTRFVLTSDTYNDPLRQTDLQNKRHSFVLGFLFGSKTDI